MVKVAEKIEGGEKGRAGIVTSPSVSLSLHFTGTPWFPLFYVAITTALLLVVFAQRTYDDPFITYRYAANLARGVGFVYNLGQRVLSTTSPLFALVLSVPAHITLDIPLAANVFGALCIAAGGWCLFDMARAHDQPIAGWVALLGYPSFSLLINTLGSEIPLYLLLCLGALDALSLHKALYCAVWSALAVLTRPDGLLLVLVISAVGLIRLIKSSQPIIKWPTFIPWREVAIFVVITGAWTTFACLYFGTPIPLTLSAKQAQGSLPVSTLYLPGLAVMKNDYLPGVYGVLVLSCILPGIALLIWSEHHWLPLFLWITLYMGAYGILGVSRYFWYYSPLVPGLVVAMGLVVQALYDKATQVTWLAIPLAILIIGLLAGQALQMLELAQHTDTRITTYKDIGEWLNRNTPAGATVGALEVGELGFYSQRTMVDFAGLLQPETAVVLRMTGSYDKASVWLLKHTPIEFLVIQQGSLPLLNKFATARGCAKVYAPAGLVPAWYVLRCPSQPLQ